MRFTRSTKRVAIVLAIVLAVFCIIAFVIPFPRNGLFWTGFVFGLIAILSQVPVFMITFRGADSARSKFYGMPIARIGVIYIVAQLIFSLIAMFLSWNCVIPVWPFVLVSMLMLGAVALGTIAADATREEIVRQDNQIKRNVSKMRELQSLGVSLASRCEDQTAAEELQKLSDALRYSDPVSSAATAESEAELKRLLDELQSALLDGDTTGIIGLCKQTQNVLAERNRICKLNK